MVSGNNRSESFWPFCGVQKIIVILSYNFLNCSGRFLNQFADGEGGARFLFINKNFFYFWVRNFSFKLLFCSANNCLSKFRNPLS